MKKVFTFFLAAVFLFSLFSFAASAEALRGDGIIYDYDYEYDDDYYDSLIRQQEIAERTRKISSFIIAGVVMPVFGIVFFAVMWKKRSIPALRCAVALGSVVIYAGIRAAFFCLTL